MTLRNARRLAAPLTLMLALAACSTLPQRGQQPLPAATSGQGLPAVPATAPAVLPLFNGAVPAGWQVSVSDFEGRAVLSGVSARVPAPAQPRVPDSRVELRRDTRHPPGGQPGEALTMQWKDAWYASLRLEGGAPLDLRPWMAGGVLSFDLKVSDMAKGGLTFTLGCGKDCSRKLPWVLPSRALAGQGWQRIRFALRCFARDGDDFSAVTQAFGMDSSGTGEASVADIRLEAEDPSNPSNPSKAPLQACPDYRTESVTPSPLNQVWALEWWTKRHEQKLEEVRQARAKGQLPQLVFIGDSITHGWEDAGKRVWEAEFGRYHPLDLGFGGDHTENVLWRLQHGEVDGIAPQVAVLMIGTNNTGDRGEDPRTTAAGIRAILDELRQRLPDTRILLLAVFPRDARPDSPLRRLNDRVNAQIRTFADGERIVFLDINAQLMNADGSLSTDILPDLLHLSDAGYQRWARAIQPTLQDLLSRP